MLKKFVCLILCLLLFTVAVGCDKTEDAYIYFELPNLPYTLDPQTAQSDAELLVVRNIYEGLMRKNEKGETVLGAAEDLEKNGLTYTFKLRADAKWNNGDSVTAEDFVFGIKRAVNPATKAPFASRLFAIKNARKINKGELSINSLGISAPDSKTVKIRLEAEDSKFLDNLASSVAMPCNESFFNESAGKYGLFADNIICNSSYRLTKWNKESFGIRLYKNEEYNGSFIAKNAAVFLTCNNDEPVTAKLRDNNIDIAFIEAADSAGMTSAGFQTAACQNICWVMTLSDDFSPDMRKALIKLIGSDVIKENLKTGYSFADSVFPSVFGSNIGNVGVTGYNLNEGKALYNREIKKLEGGKFPTDVILYYYDNPNMKSVVTDIVGHWQNRLAAFVNIEAVTEADTLLPQLKKQSLKLAVFPVRADSENLGEYLKKFGISYKNQSRKALQKEILESNNITPIAFQNTTICYSAAIKEIFTDEGNGFIDFSLIVKED